MMLVVNKMSSMNEGNTPALQREVRNKTFLPVVGPDFKPEDFFISYVDAQCYEDSLSERDPEAKRDLEKESGWATFVSNIDKFIKEKGVLGKTTTSLHRLEQILCDANAGFKSGDTCIDGTVTTLNEARRVYSEAANNIRRKSQDLISAQNHEILKMSSKNPNGTIFQIMRASSSSGTTMHKVVYNVGKFFGHNFKPWGAIKFARGLAVAGKVLGAVGPFISVLIDWYQADQERKREEQMTRARQEVSQNFNKYAGEVEMEFDKQTNTWIEQNIDTKIKEIDGEITELQNLQNRTSEEFKTYELLLTRTRQLIDYIQRS